MGFGNLTSFLKLDFSARDKNINRQIIFSFLAKGLGLSISLVQVPLLLNILGTESYGIWLTLLSITSWISIMDIGIGNGLRNKLAESLAVNDLEKARKYVSTSYVSLSLIMILPLVIIISILPFINLQELFNTSKNISNQTILLTLLITILSTTLAFILGLINQILFALQKNSLTAIPTLIFSVLFLLTLYVLSHYINIQLVAISYLSAALSTSITIAFSVYIFTRWSYLKPSFNYFHRPFVKDILTIGLRFFIIQIAWIVIFSTDNFLITRLFGPELVSSFNITFRLFNFISTLLSLAMIPFWSAYTEAYTKKEFTWISKRIKLMNLSMLPIILVLIVVVYFHDLIIHSWIGDKIQTPLLLPFFMGIYVLISAWNNIYALFLNGISRTKEQLITSIIAMFLNIPLSIFLAKNCALGINGIIISSIICLLIFAVVGPITTYKILKAHD